jgi:acyl carrier protein
MSQELIQSEELTRRVISVIAASQKIEPEKITIDSTFEELGIDSLDGVTILFALENEFNINIPDEGAQGMHGVRDIVEALSKLMASNAGQPADAAAQS